MAYKVTFGRARNEEIGGMGEKGRGNKSKQGSHDDLSPPHFCTWLGAS